MTCKVLTAVLPKIRMYSRVAFRSLVNASYIFVLHKDWDLGCGYRRLSKVVSWRKAKHWPELCSRPGDVNFVVTIETEEYINLLAPELFF